jgi:hypothetical protein
MRTPLLAVAILAAIPALAGGTETNPTTTPPKPATSKFDPAAAAADTKEDIRRHRIIAAAHEAAAKCREAGRSEDACMAELAKACAGIAYGKYCGMKHPD